MLCLPPPLEWAIGAFSLEWIKHSIRATVSISIAAVLVRTQLASRSAGTVLDRLLQYLVELECRQASLWNEMELRILVALQRLRRSGSSSRDNTEAIDIAARGHAREQDLLRHIRLQATEAHLAASPARNGHDGIANHRLRMHSPYSVRKQVPEMSGGRNKARQAQRLSHSGAHHIMSEPAAVLPDLIEHAIQTPARSSLRRQRPQRLGAEDKQDMPRKVPGIVHHNNASVGRSERLSESKKGLRSSASLSELKEVMEGRQLSQESGAAHRSPGRSAKHDRACNKRVAGVSRQPAKKKKKVDN